VYFWNKRGVLDVTPRSAAIAFVMWIANAVAAKSLLSSDYAYGSGYYFASFLFVIVVAGLAKVQWSPLLKQIDRALGEIAYPTFLIQWLAGFLTALFIGSDIWRGWTLTFMSLPLIFLMAFALAQFNARYIEPVRMALRFGNSPGKVVPVEPTA